MKETVVAVPKRFRDSRSGHWLRIWLMASSVIREQPERLRLLAKVPSCCWVAMDRSSASSRVALDGRKSRTPLVADLNSFSMPVYERLTVPPVLRMRQTSATEAAVGGPVAERKAVSVG